MKEVSSFKVRKRKEGLTGGTSRSSESNVSKIPTSGQGSSFKRDPGRKAWQGRMVAGVKLEGGVAEGKGTKAVGLIIPKGRQAPRQRESIRSKQQEQVDMKKGKL